MHIDECFVNIKLLYIFEEYDFVFVCVTGGVLQLEPLICY